MAPQDEPNILVPFYRGTAGDHQDRMLEEILNWPDQLLESCHDYIQTLFPLPETSRFSWKATLIDQHVFQTFRSSPELREALRRSFNRMLSFYGLESSTQDGKVMIRRAGNFPSRAQNWVARVDHNHLRITRIIRSLRILGLEKEAEALFEILSDVYMNSSDRNRPCKESMKYWTRAAKRPLNFAPDVNDISDERAGEEFLWKYEMAKAAGENTEESQISNVPDDSDGGVMLPRDDDEGFASGGNDVDSKTIEESAKDEKAKAVQSESDDTELELTTAHVSDCTGGPSNGDSSPSLKRKTRSKAEETSRKAQKSEDADA